MNAQPANPHDLYHEQLSAYALDALDPDEVAALETHLATCAACQSELAGLRALTTLLALDAGAGEEPAGHRDRFQRKLESVDQLAAPNGHRERFRQKLESEGPTPAPAAMRRPAAPPARPPWWQVFTPRAGWGLAGACALGLLLALLWGLDAQQR
ncbi:MAG TPA: zf-HC2 domain-containing protein, partial [Chloroflexia bacterium]|nr:zf-HC2 domain-containing protein [Chloroflexia bacterium]